MYIFCVTSAFFDDGSTMADVEGLRYTGEKMPESVFYHYDTADVYKDYYSTLEEAEQAKKEVLNA